MWKKLHRISKIKAFVSKYNWKGIYYLSEKDNQKRFEKSNVRKYQSKISNVRKYQNKIRLCNWYQSNMLS